MAGRAGASRRDLWLRWSWRDLRGRWPLVAVIALVIALGTGTYAALLSTSAWRTRSNDASFALLHTHDLRAALAAGSTVPEGRLLALARGLPHASQVAAVRERLVVPTQVAGPGGILVPGELVGTAQGTGPGVDEVYVAAGRPLSAAGDGRPVVVLEQGFARQNHLPDAGTLRVSGGATVRYTGVGQSPEYFIVTAGTGGAPFLSQKAYAVLFATVHTAQALAGAPGRVNDLVLTLKPGADRALLQGELQRALAAASPPVSAAVTNQGQIESRRILYEDIKGDTELWRVIALLVLAGAAFAALNLTARVVEAQRREIGIGMALGVRARRLALRPLLFGAQVAVIGVLLGVAVGYGVGILLRNVFTGMLPLPVWQTPFQAGTFAQAAAIGFVLPFAAVAWPVWRAVRVQPVEAIRVGHLAARGGGLAPLLRRLPLPGRGYHQIPVRNVLRTPRRSALTVLGIGAALATLVTITGFLDTFRGTLSTAQDELLRAAPSRVSVSLDSFYPADSPVIQAVRKLAQAGDVQAGLLAPATIRNGGRSIQVAAEVLPAAPSWTPSLVSGTLSGGIVLSSKAAADLHAGVGSTVLVEHPQVSAGGMRTVLTRVMVSGIHPSPMRGLAYFSSSGASIFGLAGAANLLTVQPASGYTTGDLQRALLGVPHVASAQSVKVVTDGLRDSLGQFTGILNVAAAVSLLLVLLIAFNNTSIGVDERSREHATMIAFGLPLRAVLAMTTVEAALIGTLGTLAGIAGGYGLLSWMVATTIPGVMPELGVTATLTGASIITALLLGLGTVSIAPLFTLRRLRRMDIPSTLRLVE
jgi:putative ABC transport system permease protein